MGLDLFNVPDLFLHHELDGVHLVRLYSPLELLVSWLRAGYVGGGQAAAVPPLRAVAVPVLQDPAPTRHIYIYTVYIHTYRFSTFKDVLYLK